MPKGYSERERRLPGISLHGRWKHRSVKTNPWETTQSSQIIYGRQFTGSEGHPWKGHYSSGDVGGPFLTVKRSVKGVGSIHLSDKTSNFSIFDGTISHPITVGLGLNKTIPFPDLPKALDTNAMGAVAVSRCSPTNPVANASTFLAEMVREGFPSLPGIQTWANRTKALLAVSSEFLNTEFGWLPLLNEVTEFRDAVKHATTVLQQYKRDEGKLVRRRYAFPIERTESIEPLGINQTPHLGGSPTFSDWGNLGGQPLGDTFLIKLMERKVWFSGAFRYYIPTQSDSWNRFIGHGSEADKLFGITLTPETLWELTPWSWAVDYFSNAQEVITNLQNMELYGLIMPYGYMMEETIEKHTYTWKCTNASSTSVHSCPDFVLTTVRKNRDRANPFGFGLTSGDLSPTQLAILAACGITLAL